MKFTSTIAVLGFAAAPLVLAQQAPTCYPTGSVGANGCTRFISEFCSSVSQSQFRPGDNGARCFNAGGYRCDFTAYNSIDTAGPPDARNCQVVLNNIAKNCRNGGEGKVADANRFTFSVDPNSGSCGTTSQPGS